MTNNLTPKQIADGWRHISEIVNEPDDGMFQLGNYHPRTENKIQFTREIWEGKPIQTYLNALDIYRRLIPALLNQVVIVERDDVDFMMAILFGATHQIQPNSHMIEKCNNLYDRLRAKLEGK